jgi:phosphatidyl-myo-inositol alpha-mannosyltransferase
VDVEGLTRGHRVRALADGRLNLLCAAGSRRRGDLDLLLEAVRRAQRSLELRVLVLCDDPFAPRGRAPAPCAAEGSAEVRYVPGRSEDRATWYATADVCCVPFPAGPAVLEAMAAGKPVLAVDAPEHRELLRHGREGELLPPQDPGAWAHALVRLVREPLRGAVYGERGRATSQRYAWPAVAREILNLYRAIGVRG